MSPPSSSNAVILAIQILTQVTWYRSRFENTKLDPCEMVQTALQEEQVALHRGGAIDCDISDGAEHAPFFQKHEQTYSIVCTIAGRPGMRIIE
jgi:hypothetical protein